MDKAYRYAVKAGGRIFPAGTLVSEVAQATAKSVESAAAAAAVGIAEAAEAAEAAAEDKSGAQTYAAPILDDLDDMKKAELEEIAKARGISLAGLKTKAEYIAAIKAAAL